MFLFYFDRNDLFFFMYRILVLSNGRLAEYDEPARLAANPKSAFSKLLRDANIQLPTVTSISG
jgi:ABC-type proline/glycine betaine transport system ATPase subunit